MLVKTKALGFMFVSLKTVFCQESHAKALLFKGSQNKYFHKNVIHYFYVFQK